jgi:Condensation domain/Phosphopantetheine attachment site/AMP-binding enzyme C-terminal domain
MLVSPTQAALVKAHATHARALTLRWRVTLEPGLDDTTLERALQEVVIAHPALRQMFRCVDETIHADLLPPSAFTLGDDTLDLDRGPLFALSHDRDGTRSHLHFTAHHAILDFVSGQVVSRDLVHACHHPGTLTLDDAFFAHVQTQHERLATADVAAFASHLRTTATLASTAEQQTTRLFIDAANTRALRHFARTERLTLYAALHAWIAHWAQRRPSVCIGMAVLGRGTRRERDAVGCFADVVAVTSRPVGSFVEMARACSEDIRRTQKDIPLASVLAYVARRPFDVLVSHHRMRRMTLIGSNEVYLGHHYSFERSNPPQSLYPVAIAIEEYENTINLVVTHETSLASEIGNLLPSLSALLTGVHVPSLTKRLEAQVMQHPAVADAVAGVSCDSRGQERLALWVRPDDFLAPVSSAEIARFLRRRIGAEKLPDACLVTPMLFRTDTAEPDLTRLPIPPWLSAPPLAFTPPQTEIERQLAVLWQETLARTTPVGRFDNFFHLGGDSLMVLHVSHLARQRGLTIFPEDLLRHPLLADLAQACERSQNE